MKHAPRAVSLGIVLACVSATFMLGVAHKSYCAAGSWADRRQYTDLCYSDIVPLLGTEQLGNGRLPFLQACEHQPGNNCDEYPVLTMYFMRIAGWISGNNYGAFYFVNAILLFACAAGTAVGLWMLVGRRALWFALAPTLVAYGTMNWDLFAVALATAALVSFADRRDAWAGALLGLGAAAKLYPGFIILPLFLSRLHDREPDRAVRLLWSGAASYLLVNLPFVIAAPGAWWEFFRFNGTRTADFDSLWFIACRHASWTCLSTASVNIASAAAFVVSFCALWWWKRRRDPQFARWALGFPMLACFLLSNKVYSPQFGLWLLPWFALALPDLRLFIAFEAADIGVFVTRFWFFGELGGSFGVSQGWFEVAVIVRALVLTWCLIAWVRLDVDPVVLTRRAPLRRRTLVEAAA